MNILIVQGCVNTCLVTGEEIAINNDIRFLQASGINVFYEKIKIPNFGWRSIIAKIGGLVWSFSSYKKVKIAIRRFKPDVVHFHSITPYLSYSAILACHHAGIPMVQTLHNGRWLCLEGGYFRKNTFCNDCVGSYGWLGFKRGCGHGKLISLALFLNNFFVRKFGFLFKHISCFIAVSDYVKDQHIKSGFPNNKVIVRNNGFDYFVPCNISKSWDFREGVVYAGRISIAKGSKVLEYLIKNLKCKIRIIGNGPEFSSLKKICIDNHYNHVKLLGRLDNKSTLEIIKNSVVSVVPSQCGDSYPTVALESLSVGTPIVASNLGGLTDIINSSLAGKLVDYRNYNAFLKNVQNFLCNREKAKNMGNNGIKYIKENVGTNKQGKELICIYNKVIKNHKSNK